MDKDVLQIGFDSHEVRSGIELGIAIDIEEIIRRIQPAEGCQSISTGGDVDRQVAGQGIENSLDRKNSTGFESLEPGGQCVLKSLASHRSQLPVDERQNRLGGELGEGL